MTNNLKLIFLILLLCGCKSASYKDHLETGLKDYKKVRHINENLIQGYPIQKLAFFKKDTTSYRFIYLLGNNVVSDSVEKYSLGMTVFPEKEYVPKDKNFVIWSSQPSIETVNGFKYVIMEIETPIKRIDSLQIFIFDRDGYKGVLGDKMIRLKNIQL